MLKILRVFFVSLLSLSLVTCAQAKPRKQAKLVTGDDVKKRATQLVNQNAWGEIEDWIIKLEKSRNRTPDGRLMLDYVHYGIATGAFLERHETDAKWLAWYEKIDQWSKNAKRSDIAAAIKIDFWTSYAWKGRTNKLAKDVEPQQWKRFRERLLKAKVIYDAELDGGQKCVGFYAEAMTLALGAGWSSEQTLEQLVIPAIRVEPESLRVYYAFLVQLEPKWGGNEHDDYRFLSTLPDLIVGEIGAEMYARVLLYKKQHEITGYQYDLVDWDTVKAGAESVLRKYPKASTFAEIYIGFAMRYGETEYVVERVQTLAQPAFQQFSKNSTYGRAISLSEELDGGMKALNFFKPMGNLSGDYMIGPAWLPSGEGYFMTAGYKGVEKFSKDGVQVAEYFKTDRNFKYLCISPDGKYLAAATSYDAKKWETSKIYVLDVSGDGMELVREIDVTASNSKSICFSSDGETLYYSSLLPSGYNKKEDVQFNELQYCRWREEGAEFQRLFLIKGPHVISDLKVHPSGKYLYCSLDGLRRFDLEDMNEPAEVLINGKNDPLGYVWDFDFIGDTGDIVAIRFKKKRGHYLSVIDGETGRLITDAPINQFIGHFYTVASTRMAESGKYQFFATGKAAALGCWEYDLKSNNLELIDVGYGNGQNGTTIGVSPRMKEGVRVTVGTEHGMIGNWLIPSFPLEGDE